MRRIGSQHSESLYGVAATRAIEQTLAASLPPFELMSLAGASVARLACALAPHASCIWIACGPGNNGGDGLVAARHLLELRGSTTRLVVTLAGNPASLPPDASRALAEAQMAGINLSNTPPDEFDLCIDALLGIGARDVPNEAIGEQLRHMHASSSPVLSVDIPSGLLADTGVNRGPAPAVSSGQRHTLALLTLKPGLFTADGRDLCGSVWFDPLVAVNPEDTHPPQAMLFGQDAKPRRFAHASHKGTRGDVVVIGGQDVGHSGSGMTGAAVLAARAALHAGAGRVYLGLLGSEAGSVRWDPACPELMFRNVEALASSRDLMQSAVLVCGCGGGSSVASVLPQLLSNARSMVLDADALNRIAEDPALLELLRSRSLRKRLTVITPHPKEAARLLGIVVSDVMKDRLGAAKRLSESLGAICVLKGSGTVVAGPGAVPRINHSGNPALATAGTGDVLAGWIGAMLATEQPASVSALESVCSAVFMHGHRADQWIGQTDQTLTAGRLVSRMPLR